ncbi:MAG: hypothetical protein NT154_17435, partial [Verrucomicrobia bacterium]|nr:hypothetical protein [Verrucomicrobiota bacterium]
MIIPPESLNPGHNSLNAMGQWGVPIEPGRYFAGSLDEVRLYSRALDVADVATLAGVTPPNRPPAVSCPPASALGCAGPQGLSVVVQTLMTDPDTGTLTVTLKEDGTARDTQTVASPAQNQAVNFASVTFLPGTHTLTIEVSDGSKTASCQTTLEIVQDTQPPTITAPAAVTVNTDAGKCEATSVVLGTSTTADNCGVATVANNAPTV